LEIQIKVLREALQLQLEPEVVKLSPRLGFRGPSSYGGTGSAKLVVRGRNASHCAEAPAVPIFGGEQDIGGEIDKSTVASLLGPEVENMAGSETAVAVEAEGRGRAGMLEVPSMMDIVDMEKQEAFWRERKTERKTKS
jgi:hypothetical protein